MSVMDGDDIKAQMIVLVKNEITVMEIIMNLLYIW